MKDIIFLINDFKSNLITIKEKWVHSLLSTIGIVIAITSLIVMISVSQGAKIKTLQSIEDLGINTIRFTAVSYSLISSNKQNLSIGLNHNDFKNIKRIIKNNGFVSVVYKKEKSSLYLKNSDITTTLYGSDENFLSIEGLKIIKGRPLIRADIQNLNKTAIISLDLYKKYKLDINNNFIYNNTIYRVIGVCETKDNLKNFVLTSYTHFDNTKAYDNINIYIKDINSIFIMAKTIENKILKMHNNIKNFRLNIPLKTVTKQNETTQLFNMILLSIALMSLLSGGISVMNAVLSNISEQTREIGLKMALGATAGRIVQFYLIYTVILTLTSGVLSGIISLIILYILSIVSTVFIVFSIKAFFIGFIMSIFSGIFFGLYPALRAANIEPIQALREF